VPTPEIAVKKQCTACGREVSLNSRLERCPFDGDVLAPVFEDEFVNRVFDEKFLVLEFIGSGGWSSVYKARQLSVDRLVALKILHNHLVKDPDKVQRFAHEAKAVSRLSHPNIVMVFDYGTLPRPYIVMDYVDGASLADSLSAHGPVPVETAVPIFVQVCAGLQHAHDAGIIHRDLKPNNVMLLASTKNTPFSVKLADFGIAKIFNDDRSELTRTGDTVGSPAYMSPEQCCGEKLDARSDIYSLGCMMYETVTGQRPFYAENGYMTMHKQINEVPAPPSSVLKGIPTMIDKIILHALEKDPANRFQSMNDLAAALQSRRMPARAKGTESSQQRAATPRVIPTPSSTTPAAAINAAVGGESVAGPHTPSVPVPGAMPEQPGMQAAGSASSFRAMDPLLQPASPAKKKRRSFSGGGTASQSSDSTTPRWVPIVSIAGVVLVAMSGLIAFSWSGIVSGIWSDAYDAGVQAMQKKSYKEAEERLRFASSMGMQLGPTDSKRILPLWRLVQGYREQNNIAAAEQVNNELKGIIGANGTPKWRNLYDEGVAAHKAGKLDQSEQLLVLANNEAKTLGPETIALANSENELGQVYLKMAKLEQAEQVLTESLALREKLLFHEHPDVYDGLNDLARVYKAQKRYDDAERLFSAALEVARKNGGDTGPRVAALHSNIGSMHFRAGKHNSAIEHLTLACKLAKQNYGEMSPVYARMLNNLGEVYRETGRTEEATKLYEQCLAIYKRLGGSKHPDTAPYWQNLAVAYADKHRFGDAERALQNGILANKTGSYPNPMLMQLYRRYAEIMQKKGDLDSFEKYQQLSEVVRRDLIKAGASDASIKD
jgi:eukaryotic-like serine/threonine-protein kinase